MTGAEGIEQQHRYRTDEQGFADWMEVSHVGLGNRSVYLTTPYIHGRESDGHPALAAGLRIEGDARDLPYGMRIHAEDIDEMIRRVTTFERLVLGFVKEEDGNRPLTQEEVDTDLASLTAAGLDRDYLIVVGNTRRRTWAAHQFAVTAYVLSKAVQS